MFPNLNLLVAFRTIKSVLKRLVEVSCPWLLHIDVHLHMPTYRKNITYFMIVQPKS